MACVRLWNTSLLRQCSAINVRVCHTFFVAGSFLDKPIVEKETLGICYCLFNILMSFNFLYSLFYSSVCMRAVLSYANLVRNRGLSVISS